MERRTFLKKSAAGIGTLAGMYGGALKLGAASWGPRWGPSWFQGSGVALALRRSHGARRDDRTTAIRLGNQLGCSQVSLGQDSFSR